VSVYLVGIIDTATGQFRGCDIFSEPSPTLHMRSWPFVIAQVTRETFDEAEAELRRVLAENAGLQWAQRFLVERDGRKMPPDCVALLTEGVKIAENYSAMVRAFCNGTFRASDCSDAAANLRGWIDSANAAVRRLAGGAA